MYPDLGYSQGPTRFPLERYGSGRVRGPHVLPFQAMRRRLRKKQRLGEFVELGFVVRAELVPALDDPGFDAFLDRLIDAVEARGLLFGGGGRRDSFEGFVCRRGRASATDADRAGRELESLLLVFVISDCQLLEQLCKSCLVESVNCDSDHRVVQSTIRIQHLPSVD